MIPDTAMVETVLSVLAHIVFAASILNLLLPPYEVFDDFPGFQRYYKLILNIIGNLAMSGRGKMIQLYSSVADKKPLEPKP